MKAGYIKVRDINSYTLGKKKKDSAQCLYNT